ncbi:hypothetical protein PPTG_24874 [Phytophthora nicotianae INRA-310]|uniref:UBA domain-containing protein n=2 Tax=Phytophthora nicotianae TaxID=4792 RepID=W2PA02_PHYN3|nr:hypothetical protein PPTG_24874 [Phytophthora nicotianae INRA-310]ETM97661.1 hypothetical protein PPTG_24874 [Phytophthora nicotianae INRA-310]
MESEEPATVDVDTKEVRVDAPAAVVSSAGGSVNVPAPSAVISQQNEEELRWTNQLQALADMGFTDKTRNVALLSQHKGDMDAVITGLLSSI